MIETLLHSLLQYRLPISICLLIFACWKYYKAFSPQLRRLDVPSIDGTPSPYGKEFGTSILEGTRKVGAQYTKNKESLTLYSTATKSSNSIPLTMKPSLSRHASSTSSSRHRKAQSAWEWSSTSDSWADTPLLAPWGARTAS